MTTLSDFAPDDSESGVGLALQDEWGDYLFFLAGTRHHSPEGELFYAGIGGHREKGESWLECAHREAKEEVGTDVKILSAAATWHVAYEGTVKKVELDENPSPFALYEMIHPPGTPNSGELYRIVIYKAQLCDEPRNLPEEELRGVIALRREQIVQSLERKPTLAELLSEGAKIVIGGKGVSHQVRLYPIGTARALAHVFRQIDE
jgi:8-oxo-dGTP pyrophosphatase MutT (NUDIX family)